MVVEPEFARTLRVMSRDGSTLSSIIRELWDMGNVRSLTKNSPAKTTEAHVSIVGHITKDELLRHLDDTEAGNGFGNRFLWTCVRRSKCLPEGGQLHQENFSPFIRRLGEAVAFSRTVGQMTRDEETRKMWAEVYPRLSEGGTGLFGAITSRGEAQVTRLSCLYALLDLSAVVKAEALKAALALWQYCEASARYIFGENLGHPLADAILRALRATPEGMTRTDVQNFFGRNRKGSQIDQALGFLYERGLVGKKSERTEGRPAERWFANMSKYERNE